MIEKLTPEQEAAIPVVRDEWIDHGLSTAPANRKEVEEGIHKAYKEAGLSSPKEIHWFSDPFDAIDYIKGVFDKVGVPFTNPFNSVFYGQFEAGWLGFYDFFRKYTDIKGPERLDGLMQIAKNGGPVWLYRGLVVCCDRPEKINRDKSGKLHNSDGPAFIWRSGVGMVFEHGEFKEFVK